ncbi:hypothetical protein STEG23_023386, partial [Scotinomys teguina]
MSKVFTSCTANKRRMKAKESEEYWTNQTFEDKGQIIQKKKSQEKETGSCPSSAESSLVVICGTWTLVKVLDLNIGEVLDVDAGDLLYLTESYVKPAHAMVCTLPQGIRSCA